MKKWLACYYLCSAPFLALALVKCLFVTLTSENEDIPAIAVQTGWDLAAALLLGGFLCLCFLIKKKVWG